jgi:hypothetical protein
MRDNFILPKRDGVATKALRANRFFADPNSYITFADSEGICHFVLEGQDRSRMRSHVYALAQGRCEAKTHAPDCSGVLNPLSEMDHIRGGDSGRCDCLRHGRKRGNLQMLTVPCHTAKHNRIPKFGPRIAVKNTQESVPCQPPETAP